LHVGRDDSGSGGDGLGATFIHEVSPGGASVTDYGAASIFDPDSVLFDVDGTISGVAGSVLVGSSWPIGGTGIVSPIHPDESVVTLFDPASVVRNPSAMSFDSTGRMLLLNEHSTGRSVVESTGGLPTVLFTSPSTERPFDQAIDSLDRIYTRDTAGVIRIHDSTGALVNGSFSVLSPSSTSRGLEIAPGGVWGTDLFPAAPGGDLMRIDGAGVASTFGTGFGNIGDIKFGLDGAMYISTFDGDQILRLTVAGTRTLVLRHGRDWAAGPFGLSTAPLRRPQQVVSSRNHQEAPPAERQGFFCARLP